MGTAAFPDLRLFKGAIYSYGCWWVGVCSDPSPVVETIRGLLLLTNLRCGVSAARKPSPILHAVEVRIDTLRPEHRTDSCSATTLVLKGSL